MILREVKEVRIAALRLPGNFGTIQRHPDTKNLAISIQETGMVEMPAVEKGSLRVVYGFRRIAAHKILNRATIVVQMVELEDGETHSHLRLASNGARPSTAEERSQIADAFDRKVAELVQQNPTMRLRGGGRTKTIESLAAEELALELGVQPESIKVRRRRAVKRSKSTPPPPPPPFIPVAIDIAGAVVGPEWLNETTTTLLHYNAAIEALRTAYKHMAKYQSNGAREQAICEGIAESMNRIKVTRPVSVCPFCKCVPEVMEECARCVGKGWVGTDGPFTPKHLLNTDNPEVNYRGRAVPVAEFVAKEEAAADDDFLKGLERGDPEPETWESVGEHPGEEMDPADFGL